MKLTENGLVLRQVKLREADQILTLLTPRHGIVSVSARGSLRPNNKLFAASGLFCYSEWTLHEGKTMYSVDEAAPIEVFFELRSRIEAVALATYIAELLQIFSPTGGEAEKLLRLALNSFHLLGKGGANPLLMKAVFELRSLSETGYMPDIAMCAGCGRYEGGPFFFEARSGALLCADCAAEHGQEANLSPGALAALRHIVLSDDDKLFGFTLSSDEGVALLARVAEAYTLFHLDYPPKSLDFLKTVL